MRVGWVSIVSKVLKVSKIPARALPFHPDGLSGSIAALSGEIPLICSCVKAVVFPLQFSDFPSDSLSSLAGSLVFHINFP